MTDLNQEYWNKRYEAGHTGWDVGHVSPPIKSYLDTLKDKSLKILIPGAGNAYEVSYAYNLGFKNAHLLDFATNAVASFINRNPTFPETNIHVENFFEHNSDYDLIIEQTFFCALHPSKRPLYVEHMHSLLKKGGILAGLLFCREFEKTGPPFGGTSQDYETLFNTKFDILRLDTCETSIAPRAGNELFFEFRKK